MWSRGWIVASVEDIEVEMRCCCGSGETAARDDVKEGRVTMGKLREAVRILTSRSGGGSLQPDDLSL